MLARKGNIKTHHFAHTDNAECKSALDTVLQIIVKNILEKNSRIVLPPLKLRNSDKVIYGEAEVTFHRVVLEEPVNALPYIRIYVKESSLLIQASLTSYESRFNALHRSNFEYSVIRINLGAFKQQIFEGNWESSRFEQQLINDTSIKSWINNTKQNAIKEKIEGIATCKLVVHTNLDAYPIIVENCPLNKRVWKSGYKVGQSYACVFDDCGLCPYGKVIRGKNILITKRQTAEKSYQLNVAGIE